MRDPLRAFDWLSLYARYDAMCPRFDSSAVQLEALKPRPQSDRELYYRLVESVHPAPALDPQLSIGLYEALLYWKLYSNPKALGNVQRWLRDDASRKEATVCLADLARSLPTRLDRNADEVVRLVDQLGAHKLIGIKTDTALPVRTTLLHYLFPDVVPIFDKFVLQAVEISEQCANKSRHVLRQYLPFAWGLADQYAAQFAHYTRETPVRLIDMALWVVRGKGAG